LARAGTGDVLAGVLVALLGQMKAADVDIMTVLSKAVVWHAKAGESDVWYRSGQLPTVIASLARHLSD